MHQASVNSESELTGWVIRARQGDVDAQRYLFDAFQGRVLAFCLAATRRDRALALDLLQEIFTRVFSGIAGLRQPEAFCGWLFTIAANVCRSRLARESRMRAGLQELCLESDVFYAPAQQQDRSERLEVVRRIIEGISDAQLKQMVLMKYSEPEHTTRQIAKALGVPHGTVTVKLMRFRAAARRELLREIVETGRREVAS